MGVVLEKRKDFFGTGSQLSIRNLVPFFYVIFIIREFFLAQSTAEKSIQDWFLAMSCSIRKDWKQGFYY